MSQIEINDPTPVRICMKTSLFAEGNVLVFLLKNTPNWQFEDHSPNLQSFLGYSEEEVKQNRIGLLQLVHPEDREKMLKSFQEARKSQSQTWHYSNLRIIRKDGRYIWAELRLFFIREENRVNRFLGYLVDITKSVEDKKLLETFMEFVPVGIFLHKDGKFIYMNEKARQIGGYTIEELRKMDSIYSIIYPEDRPIVEKITKMREEGKGDLITYRIRIITKDDRIKWVQVTSKMLGYKGENLIIGAVQDIDRLVQLEFAKNLLTRINRAMVGASSRAELIEAVCEVFKSSGSFRGVMVCRVKNGKITQECQYSKNNFLKKINCSEIPEKKMLKIKTPVYIPDISKLKKFKQWKKTALENKVNSLIILPVQSGNKIEYIISLYIPEKNYFSKDVLEVFSKIATDISFGLEFLKKEEDLFLKEYYDSLTNIGNRKYLFNSLKKYITKGRKFYLVLIDIYNFRFVNEKLGKQQGDHILKKLAETLDTELVYENVFRLGNDEFAVLSSDEDIYSLLDRIKSVFTNLNVNGKQIKLDYNISVIRYPEDETDQHELFLKAERTLEIAKKEGKNTIKFFDRRKYEDVHRTIQLEEKLEEALKNDRFTLCFQPIVSIKDGKLQHIELLIRWEDENGKLIPPSVFIPVAEKTGQIKDIDRWVILKLKELIKKWQNKNINFNGHTIPIEKIRFSVNITPTNISSIMQLFKDKNLISSADLKLLKKFTAIELTERQSLEIYAEKDNINKLRKMGFKIAIDDFGTGYSSLSYLTELNINYLKIDMVFIQKMLTDKRVHRLVHSIINIAKIYRLKTIAEGVETEQQLKELKKLGCHMYQGYLLSPPITQTELEKMLL
ncbi:sensor domain-containing protein [Persephonella sp.]